MPHDGAELGYIHVDGEAARPGLLAFLRECDDALRGELRGKVTFELIVQPLQNVILIRLRLHRAARLFAGRAVFRDDLAELDGGGVDSVVPVVDFDLFGSCPGFGSAFGLERFCYTLPSLAYLDTPATADWQD
jgi:hypothetical protein